MIKDYIFLGLKNLKKRKLRSWLTILGIFIAIATIFVLVSVSIGLQDAVKEQFRQLGTDKFFVMPRAMNLGGPSTSAALNFTLKDAEIISKVQGVRTVTSVSTGNAEIKFSDKKRYVMAIGIVMDDVRVFLETSGYKLDEGDIFGKSDSGKVILGSQYKYNKVFDKPIETGDTVEINGQNFKVSGIFKSLGNPTDDKNIYMTFDDAKLLFKTEDNVAQIIVQVDSGQNVSEVAKRTEKKLRSYRDVDEKTQDFTILTPEELLATFGVILNIITGFLLGVAAISLIVGGIGIANTMYTAVLERRKEIGTMKAVGARNSDILWIFLIESGLLGLTGGIIGVLLGIAVSKSIEYIATNILGTTLLQAAMPWYLIVGCLAFAFLAGAISGIWPASRASKVRPVDALRYE